MRGRDREIKGEKEREGELKGETTVEIAAEVSWNHSRGRLMVGDIPLTSPPLQYREEPSHSV